MTNLQGASKLPIRREPLLLAAPAVLGALIALGLAAALVWPAWQALQRDQQQLEQLEEQRLRLPLLRAQALKLQGDLDQQQQRNQQIVGLIAGSGQLDTFLAQLSEEAQRTVVVLDGYEPTTTTAASDPEPESDAKTKAKSRSNSKAKTGDAPPPPPDPLLAPGLQKTSVLLTARGSGPQLLAFLRRLELLSLLVVQSDLSLKPQEQKSAPAGQAAAPALTELRLSLALYANAPASPKRKANPKTASKP